MLQRPRHQLLAVHAVCPQVKPAQIRRLHRGQHGLGQFLLDQCRQVLPVAVQIVHQAVQPRVAVFIRRARPFQREQVAAANARAFHLGVDFRPHRFVRHEHRCLFQPRKVERLAGGAQGQYVLLRKRQHRHKLLRRIDKIRVNLIRNQVRTVPRQQINQRLQFLPLPRAGYRVVRIAQHQRLCARLQLLLHGIQIHRVATRIVALERRIHQPALRCLHRKAERPIHRRLNHHPVARLRQRQQGKPNARHNAGDHHHPLVLNRQIVPALPEAGQRMGVIRQHQRIAVCRMQCADGNCLRDLRRAGEIHIRDP